MNENDIALARYRLEKAKSDLVAAQQTLALNLYDNAANRSYYAIFHAARAVLALDGQDFKRHSGVVGTFGRDYIKTGIFDPYLAKIIKSAFEMRTDSDYEDFYIISKTDVENQVKEASFSLMR